MKITKVFFLYLFFFLYGTTLYGSYEVSFLDSKEKYTNIEDVLNKKFTPTESKKTFGRLTSLWLKVSIINEENSSQDNYLSLTNLQIMEDVHFFTVVNQKVIKEDLSFNKYTNNSTSNRIGNSLLYSNPLQIKEKIDVYIYITAKSTIYYELYNGSFQDVMNHILMNTKVLLILIGILGTLGIYYLFLYFLTPTRSYMYYSLSMFSLMLWGFYQYGGYVYYFGIFDASVFSNPFVLLIPLFLLLFFQSLFQEYEKFKFYSKALSIVATLLIVFTIIYTLGRLGIIEYISMGFYGPLIYLFTITFMFLVAIKVFLLKLPFSGLFLFAYIVGFIGSFISILFFLGLVPLNTFTFYSNMIGGAIEGVLFSLLLTSKLRNAHVANAVLENTTKMQKVKINLMHEIISFIAHQWRQPLSSINASVLLIDGLAVKTRNKKLSQELLNIEEMTEHMSVTINHFETILSDSTKDKKVNISDVIYKAVSISKKDFEKGNIEVKVNASKDYFITTNEGNLLQVFLIVFNNAKEVFVERQISSPSLRINISEIDSDLLVEINDNAGGILVDDVNVVFDAHYTKRENNKGKGLGLYIAKILIEQELTGSVSVKNTKEGACFSLRL